MCGSMNLCHISRGSKFKVCVWGGGGWGGQSLVLYKSGGYTILKPEKVCVCVCVGGGGGEGYSPLPPPPLSSAYMCHCTFSPCQYDK